MSQGMWEIWLHSSTSVSAILYMCHVMFAFITFQIQSLLFVILLTLFTVYYRVM